MKLKKGSAAAKAYMAKLRAAKGKSKPKKVGAAKKVKSKTTKKIRFNAKNLNANQDKYKYLNKYYELKEDMDGEPYLNLPSGTVYFTGMNIGSATKNENVQIVENLKKGDRVTLNFDSVIKKNNTAHLIVVSKTRVGKNKSWEADKITFKNIENPSGVKYFANIYIKDRTKVYFGVGDLAIHNVTIQKNNTIGSKLKLHKKETRLGATPAFYKYKVGDLVKVKGKSWIMRIDKIVYAAPFGYQYFLENDVRGTKNGNAGTYFEKDIEKKVNSKIGSKLKLHKKETRLGATPKDFKTRSKTYHKDTKSHNVNIKVVSGVDNVLEVAKVYRDLYEKDLVFKLNELKKLENEKSEIHNLFLKKQHSQKIRLLKLKINEVLKSIKKQNQIIAKHLQ